ncbi:hypothetical protein C8Q75DRAFT_70343 [Abortiporus biennis]|nr:hypothetical protein C8Q75DRAFT_70343 [Abortiporus biennis]
MPPSSPHYIRVALHKPRPTNLMAGKTHLSIILMTFGLIFFFIPFCWASNSRAFSLSRSTSTDSKSYCEPSLPKFLQQEYRVNRVNLSNRKATYSCSSTIHSYCFSKLATKFSRAVCSFFKT